jgi:hypothetical protein
VSNREDEDIECSNEDKDLKPISSGVIRNVGEDVEGGEGVDCEITQVVGDSTEYNHFGVISVLFGRPWNDDIEQGTRRDEGSDCEVFDGTRSNGHCEVDKVGGCEDEGKQGVPEQHCGRGCNLLIVGSKVRDEKVGAAILLIPTQHTNGD